MCLYEFIAYRFNTCTGIDCPRGSRPDPARPGAFIPSDAFGDEAALFTREMCLQHEVEVEVEAMDKVRSASRPRSRFRFDIYFEWRPHVKTQEVPSLPHLLFVMLAVLCTVNTL